MQRGAVRTLVRGIFGCLIVLTSVGSLFALAGCGDGSEGDPSGSDSTTVAEAEDKTAAEGETTAEEDGKAVAEAIKDDEKKEKKKTREKTTSVHAVAAMKGNLVIPVIAEGKIRARRNGEIRAEIAGRIERLYVEEGSRVKKGHLIARLDGREYELAIDEARSRYLESLSRLLIEEERMDPQGNGDLDERLTQLWNDERYGRVSRAQRQEAQREIEIAALQSGEYRRDLVEVRTGLSAAQADEERARLNLERTEIRAPFTGVISKLTLNQGQRVTAGEVLCSLIDNVDIEAAVGVLESDLRGLEVGRPVLLAIPALAETLLATVDVISPTIDSDSRTCQILIRYKSEDGRLRPGMFVRASIAGQSFPDRLLVPREAILTRDGRPLLFRVDGNRAKWVYVTLGLQNDHSVEIARVLQGGPVEAGTQVIVSDHLTLTDEGKIKVKKVRDFADPWIRPAEEN